MKPKEEVKNFPFVSPLSGGVSKTANTSISSNNNNRVEYKQSS